MTGFDYVVIGIVSVSLLFGLWRGVISEVIALVAWGVGIFAAIEFGAPVGHAVFAGLSDPALRTLAGCVVIFVGVFGVMFYSVYAHRKSKGHKAAQLHENVKVEIAWTLNKKREEN